MHGPEHHIMVGAALLTAYKNAGGEIDLQQALVEMMSRGRSVPGGACGFWGACGAGISARCVARVADIVSADATGLAGFLFAADSALHHFICFQILQPSHSGGTVNFFPILPELLARAPEVEELYHKFCKKGRQG